MTASTTVSNDAPDLDRVHGFAEQLGQDAVDDEAGGVGRDDGVLAQLLGGRHRGTEGDVGRLRGLHDLDERHDRDRVEEVEADDPLGVLQFRADLLDGQRRRVGREDRLGGDVLLDVGEHLLLDAELFEDRLDDPVAVGEVGLVGRAVDERLEAVRLVGADAALAEQLVDLALDGRDTLVDALLVEVGDDHRHPEAPHEEQGELGRHQTGADHADLA